MTLYDYIISNGIGYEDLAHCVGCSAGYIIDIVHGRPCSEQLADKIYDITDKKTTVRTTRGERVCN